MPESFIGLPPDATTGKKLRTRQRTVGVNVVEEQYVIQTSERVRRGVYMVNWGWTVAAAAQVQPAGFLFIGNPNTAGSGIKLGIRRLTFHTQAGSALATPTAPRVSIYKTTFTGSPSAGNATVTPVDSAMASFTGLYRNANTGLAIPTGLLPIHSYYPIVAATAVGFVTPSYHDYVPEEFESIVLNAGELIYFAQPDAGTTGDTRKVMVTLVVEEYTVP